MMVYRTYRFILRNVEFESHSSVGVARLFIVISPSLFGRCDKRLCLPTGQYVYKPRCRRSVRSMLIAMLLIIGGIEVNPGPNFNSKFINFGLLNGQSVGRKAALVHDIIADYKFDVLALTETWIPSDAPNAVKLDVALNQYQVHQHRSSSRDKKGDGIAIVHRSTIKATVLDVGSAIHSLSH